MSRVLFVAVDGGGAWCSQLSENLGQQRFEAAGGNRSELEQVGTAAQSLLIICHWRYMVNNSTAEVLPQAGAAPHAVRRPGGSKTLSVPIPP